MIPGMIAKVNAVVEEPAQKQRCDTFTALFLQNYQKT